MPTKTKTITEVINTRQQYNTVNPSDSDHYIIFSDNDSDNQDDRPTIIHSSPFAVVLIRTRIAVKVHRSFFKKTVKSGLLTKGRSFLLLIEYKNIFDLKIICYYPSVSGQRDFTLNFKRQIQKKFPNHPNLNYTDYKKLDSDKMDEIKRKLFIF